jgi:hypothetical protein
MPNPSDSFWQSVADAANTEEVRMDQYGKQYGEEYAYRLGNAYAQYPWVNPQITVSLVLTDNDDLMPQVAEYAAARMARAGVTPRDIAEKDFISRNVQERIMKQSMLDDPAGDNMLSAMLESIKNVEMQ